MSGRACTRCGSRMRGHLRHLHELPKGQPFIWPGKPGKVERLSSCGEAFAYVRDQREEHVKFQTRWGETVEWKGTSTQVKLVAPGAMVEPVQEVEA